MNLRVLYQDEYLVAVDKPAGFHVHPPEDQSHRISNQVNCLSILGKQLNCYIHPVHRIDRATSGVVLFAFAPGMARDLQALFVEKRIHKSYYCVTRGWISSAMRVERALKSDSGSGAVLESATDLNPLSYLEIPKPVGRYSTARYTLLEASPITGRMHQIRRHCAGMAHPLIGDTIYGNGEHNRFFRTELGINSLLLKAHSVSFDHPRTGQPMRIQSRWGESWHKVFDLFGVCPTIGSHPKSFRSLQALKPKSCPAVEAG